MPDQDLATLLHAARAALALARDSDASRLEIESLGEKPKDRVAITVTRTFVTVEAEGCEPETMLESEHVTIKRGSKSRPETVLAAPAEWLEALPVTKAT